MAQLATDASSDVADDWNESRRICPSCDVDRRREIKREAGEIFMFGGLPEPRRRSKERAQLTQAEQDHLRRIQDHSFVEFMDVVFASGRRSLEVPPHRACHDGPNCLSSP